MAQLLNRKTFSCIVLGLIIWMAGPAEAHVNRGCEQWLTASLAPKAALLKVPVWSEDDLANLEDYLFAVAGGTKPDDMDEIVHMVSLFHGENALKKFDDEVRFHLFTALVAGLPEELFADPRFEVQVLKPWWKSRRIARRNWTSLPPRYNQKLMFKFSKLRLFFYLYS